MLSSPRVTLSRLRDLSNFMGGYPADQKSAAFEYIISKSFADALSLPFFTLSTNDPTKQRKVVWNGSLNPFSKAPPGPDCLIHAYGFNCVVEPTMKEGAGQWDREGAQLVRLTTDEIARFGWNQPSTYSVLVAPKIARDTFYNFHTNPSGMKIVLLEVEQVISMLETSVLATSIPSMEFNGLMEDILLRLASCPDLRSYRASITSSISTWKLHVLESEKHIFVGLKALKTMKDMNRAPPIGLGELYGKMSQNNWIKHYLGLIAQTLNMQLVRESLTRHGFACCQAGMNDTLIYPTMIEDFISRESRIHEQVRMVGFQ